MLGNKLIEVARERVNYNSDDDNYDWMEDANNQLSILIIYYLKRFFFPLMPCFCLKCSFRDVIDPYCLLHPGAMHSIIYLLPSNALKASYFFSDASSTSSCFPHYFYLWAFFSTKWEVYFRASLFCWEGEGIPSLFMVKWPLYPKA